MPDYKVALTEKAQKDLADLPDHDAEMILKGCLRLSRNPEPDGKHVKKLRGYKNLYRLRVGDYRVVFQWKGSEVVVVRLLSRQDFGKEF